MIHKINSRWISTLNIEAKTIKFPEGNIGEYTHNFRIVKDFLSWTPRREKNYKLYFIQI